MKTTAPSDYTPPICAAGVHVANVGAATCQCGERRYREATASMLEDASWNAAIEAAMNLDALATEYEARADAQHGKSRTEHDQLESMGGACRHAALRIRALKREAK